MFGSYYSLLITPEKSSIYIILEVVFFLFIHSTIEVAPFILAFAELMKMNYGEKKKNLTLER